jgi:TolB-like protein
MLHAFGDFELDVGRVELRARGVAIPVEPQVFALLKFLIENRDRMVTRDEIIDEVWGGRIVSDSAVASRIKSARQAVGDDGRTQHVIRTMHGQGFRFVADVTTTEAPAAARTSESPIAERLEPPTRPSIAVLPFRLVGIADPNFPIADALPHDLIMELSRMHWLFVIARGSSFRFRGAAAELERVRSELNVQYCLTGVVELLGNSMSISVELADTRDKGIIWAERFRGEVGAVHEIRDEIVAAVIAALEVRIPLHEARQAQMKAPENLDAWSLYHLGLHHMFRFTQQDNAAASALFARAAAMDPDFARPHAGLSFTYFQDAFLRYGEHADAPRLAQQAAAQCLERDPLDPFGQLTMGRSFWLRDDLEGSLPWLERASALNPSYAQARYSRGWAEALLGSAEQSRTNVDAALLLSPLDPLVYGMLGVRALSHIVREEFSAGAEWAERAANAPGAHALIEMIAMAAHSLNGNAPRAKAWAASVRARAGHLGRDDFLRAFPFRTPQTRKQISTTLASFGF